MFGGVDTAPPCGETFRYTDMWLQSNVLLPTGQLCHCARTAEPQFIWLPCPTNGMLICIIHRWHICASLTKRKSEDLHSITFGETNEIC